MCRLFNYSGHSHKGLLLLVFLLAACEKQQAPSPQRPPPAVTVVTLKTDARGRIRLGALEGITYIQASGFPGGAGTWRLEPMQRNLSPAHPLPHRPRQEP